MTTYRVTMYEECGGLAQSDVAVTTVVRAHDQAGALGAARHKISSEYPSINVRKLWAWCAEQLRA